MARTDPQLNIRIPIELKEKLEGAAKKSGRSTTSEIIKRLEASFDRGQGVDSFDGLREEDIKMINQMIEHLKIVEKGS